MRISRREFLRTTGIGIAASLLTKLLIDNPRQALTNPA